MQLELDHGQLSTIRMALIAWSARCEREAKVMDEFAKDETLDPDKCRRNAVASREFRARADELLAALP